MTNFGPYKDKIWDAVKADDKAVFEEACKTLISSKKREHSECRRLLRQLVSRFVRYDKARDRYVGFLQKELEKAGVDYESLPRWARLHMDQDEKFCQCREIVRIVKRDSDYMWC